MPKIYYYLFLSLFLFIVEADAHALKINIFSVKNGKGLEMDQKILADALTKLECEVLCKNSWDPEDNVSYADINIFFEILNPVWFPYASANWHIPNPESYVQELTLLEGVDLILCRTKEVERIYKELNKNTYFLGFTSMDCYDPKIPKNYKMFFHLAGGSGHKGTGPILNIWLNNPSLPLLTAIKHDHPLNFTAENLHWITHRIETQALRELQNSYGIHLCPSTTEGFGHYLMEALSTGAVVVTTNAPPMNEFVSDFLVPYQDSTPQLLAIAYYVDQNALAKTIHTLVNMPIDQLETIGKKNRLLYLKKKGRV